MRHVAAAFISCLLAFPVMAGDSTKVCEEAKGLASITEQLPGYKVPSETETPAKLTSKSTFNPSGILKAARWSYVCIALVIDETGAVQDAAAYFPKRVSLSKSERSALLSQTFSPALVGNAPVKSIVIMIASSW